MSEGNGNSDRRAPTVDEQVASLVHADVIGARTISKRSLSQKLALKGTGSAAFKPLLKNNRTARYEVAAFRIAQLLDVRTVPVSTMRELPLLRLVKLVERRDSEVARALADRALVDSRGQVTGAMIQWIKGLDSDRLRSIGGKKTLLRWLSLSGPPGDDPVLAREAAAMIAFDYVIGNWDRFSGGNVFLDPGGHRLVLIDNNGTFAPWSNRQKARMKKLLGSVERFPPKLIERLAELDEQAVEQALALEPWHRKHRLLSGEEIEMLLKRRDVVLAHINRLVQLHGEDSVLAFK